MNSASQAGDNAVDTWGRHLPFILCESIILDDWHPAALSAYDTADWVRAYASVPADMVQVQAKCHSGHAYFVTARDHLHASLRGRDLFGEQLEALHDRGIRVQANYSVVADNRQFTLHPEWRSRDAAGRDSKQGQPTNPLSDRVGLVCWNSPYREFAIASLRAFVRKYPIDSLFLDMLHPFAGACYCRHCRDLYFSQTGRPVPEARTDIGWRPFRDWRHRQLATFAAELVSVAREERAAVHVIANSPRPHQVWPQTVLDIVDTMDTCGGDPLQSTYEPLDVLYATSAWANMLPERSPQMAIGRFAAAEHQTTGIRPLAELTLAAAIIAAFDGAIQMFSVPRADGTLYESWYDTARRVREFLSSYNSFAGGRRDRSVALYVSDHTWDELYDADPDDSPFRKSELAEYIAGVQGVFKALARRQVPCEVITRRNLAELGDYEVVVLGGARCLGDEEVVAVRDYVENGGVVVGWSDVSRASEAGTIAQDFQLGDVFGIHYVGEVEHEESYFVLDSSRLAHLALPEDMEIKFDASRLVAAREGADVLGQLAFPYTDRRYDQRQWFGLWSNPPAPATEHPAIVANAFGRGSALYFAGAPNPLDELHSAPDQLQLISGLILDRLRAPRVVVSANPFLLAVTTRTENATRVHLFNTQPGEPRTAVQDVQISVPISARWMEVEVTANPPGAPLAFERAGGVMSTQLASVQMYTVVEIRPVETFEGERQA